MILNDLEQSSKVTETLCERELLYNSFVDDEYAIIL